MKVPLLTVVTITRNDPGGLAATKASAAALRASVEFEHVVVDGGDEDRATVGVAAELAYVRQQSRGIAAAFNEGIAVARGEWIWFLNGGDRVDERLEPSALFALLRNTRAEVMIAATTFDGQECPTPFLPPKMRWPALIPWIPHPSTFVRRELFAKFGDYDPRYTIAMDYEWWLRALSGDVKVDVLSLPVARFDVHGRCMEPRQQPRIRREMAEAIWKNRRVILRAWLGQTRRALTSLGNAVWRANVGSGR